jgi:hypothetical protein
MTPALRRSLELLLFGAVPIVALVLALWAYAGDDRLALDFHHEVYRQAEAVVDGRDAYESPEADLSDRSNFVWPMAARSSWRSCGAIEIVRGSPGPLSAMASR